MNFARIFFVALIVWALPGMAPAALTFDGGGQVRARQEVYNNAPYLPGLVVDGQRDPSAAKCGGRDNLVLFDNRFWGEARWEEYVLHVGVTHYCRYWIEDYGKPQSELAYAWPGGIFLSALSLEGREVWNGDFDFKVGRQDLVDADGNSVFGLERIMADGTGFEGSRSFYADMARMTWHATERHALDSFLIASFGRNELGWATERSRGLPLNAYTPYDDCEMDLYGGGFVWRGADAGRTLPYWTYVVFKRATAYHRGEESIPAKNIATFGLRAKPVVTDELSFDLEAAAQAGNVEGGGFAGGQMAFAEIDWHPDVSLGFRPYAKFSIWYLSGDSGGSDNGQGDRAWDPMWGRGSYDSEILANNSQDRLLYWTNLIYPRASVGANFSRLHFATLYSGPLFAVEKTGAGHASGDPSEGSNFEGWLTGGHYRFPLWRDERGRRSLSCLLSGELFNPGDYFDSQKPAVFFRCMIDFVF